MNPLDQLRNARERSVHSDFTSQTGHQPPSRPPFRLRRVHYALLGFFSALLGGIIVLVTLPDVAYDVNTSWILITAALVGSALGLAAYDGS